MKKTKEKTIFNNVKIEDILGEYMSQAQEFFTEKELQMMQNYIDFDESVTPALIAKMRRFAFSELARLKSPSKQPKKSHKSSAAQNRKRDKQAKAERVAAENAENQAKELLALKKENAKLRQQIKRRKAEILQPAKDEIRNLELLLKQKDGRILSLLNKNEKLKDEQSHLAEALSHKNTPAAESSLKNADLLEQIKHLEGKIYRLTQIQSGADKRTREIERERDDLHAKMKTLVAEKDENLQISEGILREKNAKIEQLELSKSQAIAQLRGLIHFLEDRETQAPVAENSFSIRERQEPDLQLPKYTPASESDISNLVNLFNAEPAKSSTVATASDVDAIFRRPKPKQNKSRRKQPSKVSLFAKYPNLTVDDLAILSELSIFIVGGNVRRNGLIKEFKSLFGRVGIARDKGLNRLVQSGKSALNNHNVDFVILLTESISHAIYNGISKSKSEKLIATNPTGISAFSPSEILEEILKRVKQRQKSAI